MNSNKVTNKNVTEVDVIILGVGTCGEDLSHQLIDAGLNVVGIEPNLVGGECPYWACLPSKMMIRTTNAIQESRRVEKLAGKVKLEPDWKPLAERIRGLTAGWDGSGADERFEKRGGKLVKGYGKLTGPRTVAVGDESFKASIGVVIATGSKPSIPPIPGLDNLDYWSTHDVIQLEELPESIIIIGGGASGCELGQVLARFNVEVTIIEAADSMLHEEEPEVSEVLKSAFTDEGIKIEIGKSVQRVESNGGSFTVTLSDEKKISAERLFLASGREVDLSNLGLESVGLDGQAKFIQVDERMRAGEGIWAMGDVTGKALFSHVALYQSAIIASELLDKEHPPAQYHAIPRGTFTDPEVGGVGMTEAKAREAGLDIAVVVKQIPATFRGAVHGVQNGLIKLIINRDTKTLVGASTVGPEAVEIMGILNLAVHERIPLTKLQNMMYAFPSFYSTIGEAVGAYGRGLMTILDPDYKGMDIIDSI
ncbi:MAG: dihydrolipoyl dehydrogenase family protein [Cyclobacteriaceae bacterium]